MDTTIKHDQAAKKFIFESNGETAFLEYEVLDNNVLDLCHTFVPDSMRGRGVAAQLTKAACEYVKKTGAKLVPSCSYVESWIRKNAEAYESLVER